jgi:4-amino-4-deoxy-L-arabinose transferase-like glycosyltransferase
MTSLGQERRLSESLLPAYQWLRACLLRAAGERALVCEYCGSAIPLGEVQCRGCGATATSKSVAAALPGESMPDSRQWLVPLLLCLVFPPALLVIVPILFWRWLRRDNRGWIVPVLICMAFPPAVLIVAPALLWRTPKRQQVP